MSVITRLRERIRNLTFSKLSEMLARDIFIAFALQIIGFGLLYVLNVLLARWLGSKRYGDYVFTYNWIVLISIVGNVGFLRSSYKFVPTYFDAQRWRELFGFLVTALATMIFGSLILAGIVRAGLIAFPPSDITLDIVLFGLWIAPLFGLTQLTMYVLRGMKYVSLALFPVDVLRPLLHIGIAYALLQMTDPAAAGYTVLLALLFSLVIVAVLHIALLIYTLRHHLREIVRSAFEPREWAQLAPNMAVIQVTSVIRARVPLIILGFIAGGEGAGIYAASDRVAYLTILIYLATQRIFSPMIASLYAKDDRDRLEWYFIMATRWSFWASVLVGVGLIALSPFLLGLLGEEFLRAQPALIILVVAQIINAATGHNAIILNFTEYSQETRRVGLWMVPMIIVSNLVLAPVWGVEGTAIATAFTLIFENIWLYLILNRRLGLKLTLDTYLPKPVPPPPG